MRTQLRPVGNSSAVIIPKPFLAQLGVGPGAELEMVLEGDRVVISVVRPHPREGWAEDAHAIAEAGDDAPVWPEFGNAGDADLTW
jgi:antitoxin MazE